MQTCRNVSIRRKTRTWFGKYTGEIVSLLLSNQCANCQKMCYYNQKMIPAKYISISLATRKDKCIVLQEMFFLSSYVDVSTVDISDRYYVLSVTIPTIAQSGNNSVSNLTTHKRQR